MNDKSTTEANSYDLLAYWRKYFLRFDALVASVLSISSEFRVFVFIDSDSKKSLRNCCWWRVKDLNLRRQSRGIYSPLPLAARATRQGRTSSAAIMDSVKGKDTLGE